MTTIVPETVATFLEAAEESILIGGRRRPAAGGCRHRERGENENQGCSAHRELRRNLAADVEYSIEQFQSLVHFGPM